VAGLFYLVLSIAAVVFVLVEGLLIFAVVRYRRRDDEDEEPAQIHGNSTLEIIWTVVPALIMALLFYLTLSTIKAQQNTPPDAMTVEVIGHQWFWEIRYDNGVILTDELRVPVGQPVELEITSKDVIHSFWIPQLAGKQDAIPGHVTSTWFEVEESGVYPGQCAEFCGLEHYAMLFEVQAMPREEFDAWMADKVASLGDVVGTAEVPDAATLPPGSLGEGETLFGSLGCQSCHSLDGSPLVGPTVQGIGQRAAGRIEGYSTEQYLAESIVRPCDYIVSEFTCVMPQNFGERLTAADLSNLIAFLSEQ
jgi:cytochrome c oxidase subunit 2